MRPPEPRSARVRCTCPWMIFPMGCGGSRADAIIEPRYHESWTRETESTWLTNTDIETPLPVANSKSLPRLMQASLITQPPQYYKYNTQDSNGPLKTQQPVVSFCHHHHHHPGFIKMKPGSGLQLLTNCHPKVKLWKSV